jgi:GntR family transcriptional regulator
VTSATRRAPSVEPASPIPLYIQIANALQASIYDGTYLRGGLLGTEKTLAGDFGVSRVTIRKAIDVLHAKGLLRAHVGQGTFVTDTAQPSAPATYHAFLDDYLARARMLRGLDGDCSEVSSAPAVAGRMGLAPGTPVMRLQRRFLGPNQESTPLSMVYFVPTDVWRQLNVSEAEVPDLNLLRCIDELPALRLVSGTQRFSAIRADAETAARLRVDLGSPILRVERQFRSESGRVVADGWVDFPPGTEVQVLLGRIRR